jgi:hypothetical protein
MLILGSNKSAFSVYIKAFENGDPMDETSCLGKSSSTTFEFCILYLELFAMNSLLICQLQIIMQFTTAESR